MISIKPAGISDLEIINQLAYEIWPSAYSEILSIEQLEYMLEKFYSLSSLQHQVTFLGHQFILVTENDTAIGFASFSPHKEIASVYYLYKIYVLPQQQGKNIGKRILDYVIDQIKIAGATSLQLNVNRNNKALFFYQKQGFKIIREEDIDIDEGYFMNDYVMELNVSDWTDL
ncbi:MAG: GNAT family N-acetyltransferase [Bacteroidota bacterium]|nr:GNAT family N-acetyltransferase [Bacteroidota bacterium]